MSNFCRTIEKAYRPKVVWNEPNKCWIGASTASGMQPPYYFDKSKEKAEQSYNRRLIAHHQSKLIRMREQQRRITDVQFRDIEEHFFYGAPYVR